MTSLAQYSRARAALAEATKVEEVLSIRDEVEHLKLHARQIQDRALLADASTFQMRVERKLGVVLAAAKDAGLIREGRPRKPKNGTSEEPFSGVTLNEVGIDKKLSAKAQKTATISEQAFEVMVESMRDRIMSGKAKVIDNAPVNGARAVMGSRQEPDDSLDYFPTPPWATRALIESVLPYLGVQAIGSVWEPACGEGHIAEVLREYAEGPVIATDIHPYGYSRQILDFLDDRGHPADWIVTNPPFGDKTEDFVLRALDRAKVGVAMFVRMQWLEGVGRYESVFRDNPPTTIAFFAERVNLCKGRWDPDGTTATAYIWLVWLKGEAPRAPFWIPPGRRKALERIDDADVFTAHPVMFRQYVPRDRLGKVIAHDPETGEVDDIEAERGAVEQRGHADDNSEQPTAADVTRAGEAASPEPASVSASCAGGAGSLSVQCDQVEYVSEKTVVDDDLDLNSPKWSFLRRATKPEAA